MPRGGGPLGCRDATESADVLTGLPFRRLFARERALESSLLFGQVVGLFTGVLVARMAGADGRGHIATLVVWAQLLGWIISLSLDKAIVILSARSTVSPREALATARFIATLWSLPILAVSGLLGKALFDDLLLTVLLVLGALATAHGELVGGWLLATHRYARFAALRAIQPATYFAGTTLVAACAGTLSNREVVRWTALAAVVSLLSVLSLGPWNPRAERSGHCRQIVRVGIGAQLAVLFQFFNSRLDLLALSVLATSRDVGVYAVGIALGRVPVFFASAGAIRSLTGQSQRLDARAIGVVCALGVGIAALSPIVIPLAFGAQFRGSIVVAQILALGGITNYFQQLFSGRLLREGWTGSIILGQVAGSVTFASGIALTRTLPWIAVASVVSYGVAAAVLATIARRHKPDVNGTFQAL